MPNTNPKYLEYKNLLDSNPNIKIFLDTISKAEGTWGKDAYSIKYGGGVKDFTKGKDKSIVGARGLKSSAHGKYQIMNDTYNRWSKELGITSFTPEEQDIIALAEMDEAGALPYASEGDFKNATFKASSKWAALPANERGQSAMKGQKAKPIETIMAYTSSNESKRAAVNKTYEDLNERRANSKDKKVIDQNTNDYNRYQKEIRAINAKQGLSDPEKNQLRQQVKQKYYRDGSLLAINEFIKNDVDERKKFFQKLKGEAYKIDPRASSGKQAGLFGWEKNIYKEPTAETFNKYKKEAKEKFGINLHFPKMGDKDLSWREHFIKLADGLEKKFLGPMPEPGIKKYGQTKQEFDERIMANTPNVSYTPTDTASETPVINPDGTIDDKATKAQAEQDAKAKKQAAIQARKNFSGSPILDEFDVDTQFADPKFKYTPGKAQIPFDAIIGLTSGIMGMEAADVDIKYRDEKISQGMLLYAQDLERIKRIGLPPEIEADLNMKISGAYQTGLENIVRASGGNRNLVLGNQGQVDMSRMQALVQVSAMDVERKDKAMAAFGEVQKYFNEFEAQKDIANNERQYTEDQKKQMAGMQLAQTGMASFMDSLQYQRDNGPGSANDMMRQYFEFSATGILKGAAPGEIGSPEYYANKQLEHEAKTKRITPYADFIKTKNAEEQSLVNEIFTQHPELNPNQNPQAQFADFKKYYDELSGDAEKKEAFYEGKDISSLATTQAQKKTDDVQAQLEGKPSPEVKTSSMNANGSVNVESGTMPIEQQKYTPKPSPSETINNAVNKGIVYPPAPADVLTKKFVGTDPNIPDAKKNVPTGYTINSKGELVPSGSTGAIVTKDKLPDSVLLDTLNKNQAGISTDAGDLSQLKIEQAQVMERTQKANKALEDYFGTVQPMLDQKERIFNEQQARNEEILRSVIH